eukprot:10465231-Heterocapsa_arctica.AAC.1
MYNHGLLQPFQELKVESNPPFTTAGAYAIDGENRVVPLAVVLMNRLRGLQAALIGSPYNYPGEPMTGFTRSCPPGPGLGTPWTDLFSVPILMMDIPTRWKG